MDYDEFVACCLQCQAKCDPSELPYVYTADDLEALAEALDRAKSGRINYLAFAGLFGRGRQTHAAGGEDSRGAGAAAEANARNAVVQHICTTLWANDVVLHKAFRCFDPDGSGRMDVADFRASLETMNATLAHPHEPLTAQQIVLLADSLPQTADAEIDYLAFMNAFEVVDTTHFEGEGRLEA